MRTESWALNCNLTAPLFPSVLRQPLPASIRVCASRAGQPRKTGCCAIEAGGDRQSEGSTVKRSFQRLEAAGLALAA